MTDIKHDTNQTQETADLLIEQFRKKLNIVGLAKIFGAKVQEIEDALWQLYALRGISTASGRQLDNLGAIVGVLRGGLADVDFVIQIRARILLNVSSGTVNQILNIMAGAFPTETFSLTEYFPAAFIVFAENASTADLAARMGAMVQTAKPAGVGAQLIFSETDLGHTFTYCDSAAGPVASTVKGFADSAAPGTGGHYAGSA